MRQDHFVLGFYVGYSVVRHRSLVVSLGPAVALHGCEKEQNPHLNQDPLFFLSPPGHSGLGSC